MTELLGATSAFKSLYDSAKALKDMNDAAVRNAAVIELQEQILAVQTQQMALINRISELEKQATKFETWEAEKQRYKLEKFPPGVHAFALKPEMAEGELPHCICQTCYQRGKKSILDSDKEYRGVHHFTCSECGTRLQVGTLQPDTASGSYDPFNQRDDGLGWMR